MPSSNPSRASTVKVFSATVVAVATIAAAGTSLVAYINGDTYQAGTQEVTTASGKTLAAGGGRFQATNLADAACRKDTSGRYYDCYQQAVFTNTGGCVAGGCTTKSYNVASITKPYSGSGIIRRTDVTCDTSTVATNVSVGQVTAVTASGNGLMARRTVGSGAVQVFATGAQLWAEATPFVKVSAANRVGNSECLLSVVSDEVYNP